MLAVYPWSGSTSGAANYSYISDEGVTNNATQSGASFSYTAVSPFYPYYNYAKCSSLLASNSVAPTPYATYVYLQMEA